MSPRIVTLTIILATLTVSGFILVVAKFAPTKSTVHLIDELDPPIFLYKDFVKPAYIPLIARKYPKTLEKECQQNEVAIRKKISNATLCNSDDECRVYSFACPFESWSIVSMDAVPEILSAISDQRESGCGLCTYVCPPNPRGFAAACRHGICEAVFFCTEFAEWIPDPISIPEHVWSEVSPYRFGAAQVRIQINESGKTVMMQIGEAPLVITQAGEFRKEVARQFKPPIFCEFDKFSKSITLDLKIPIVAR